MARFADEVSRRKRVIIASFALAAAVAGLASWKLDTRLAVVFSALGIIGVPFSSSIWLLTMQCPSCRHPFFFAPKDVIRTPMLFRQRCGHCGINCYES